MVSPLWLLGFLAFATAVDEGALKPDSAQPEIRLSGTWAALAHGVAGHITFTRFSNGTYEGHSYFDTEPLPKSSSLQVFRLITDLKIKETHNGVYLTFKIGEKLFFGLLDRQQKWINGHYVIVKKSNKRYQFDATKGTKSTTPSWDRCSDANPFTVLSYGYAGKLKLCTRTTQPNGSEKLAHTLSFSHQPLPISTQDNGLKLRGSLSSIHYGHYFHTELLKIHGKPNYYFLIDEKFETLSGSYVEEHNEYPFNGAVAWQDSAVPVPFPKEFIGDYSILSDGYAGTLSLTVPNEQSSVQGSITYENTPLSYATTTTEPSDPLSNIIFTFDQYGWWISFQREKGNQAYYGVFSRNEKSVNLHGHFTHNGIPLSFDATKIL